jgi:ribosomal 30S subunit maturation factor RimM
MMNQDRWNEISEMMGETVVDKESHRIGKVDGVAEESTSMQPTFIVVKTSLFGRRRLIPLVAAEEREGVVHVPFSKQFVLDAPVPDVLFSFSSSDEEALTRHYAKAA